MRIISRKRLNDFGKRYPDAVEPLAVWYKTIKTAKYQNPHEVKETFASASFPGDELAVFNIGGNKYRLVVNIRFRRGKVYIRHVVTHKEYDKLTKAGRL